ncbi:hypothetical protein ACPV5G_18190 [Photobacterium damselae]|uniref:hypothetical protein n=1 Tax=Photobacterium damselae TaxID=38293 RepID=UPI0040683BD0
MAILSRHYNDNRAKIQALFDFAKLSRSFNLALCYVELSDSFDSQTLAVGELLLSVACPDVMKTVPKEHRFNEVSYAISSSLQLNQDIQELKRLIANPIKE